MTVTAALPCPVAAGGGSPGDARWRRLEAAAMMVGGLAFAGLAALHLLMIATDAPMEMRDGAMLATTLALLDGRNPYAIPGLMQTGNVYGIGYPLIALPFCRLLGASYS